MIHASSLRGLAVVDLRQAEKLGSVDEVVLDPDSSTIAGLIVSRGPTLLGAGDQTLVPSGAVHAIGRDAITVDFAGGAEHAHLFSLPRLGQICGRRMVTHGGTALGAIEDVLIEPADGRIVGYAFGGRTLHALERLVGGQSGPHGYVRADADLRIGPELVVVPDDAVVGAADEAVGHVPQTSSGVRWTDRARAVVGHSVGAPAQTRVVDAPAAEPGSSPEAAQINAQLGAVQPAPDEDEYVAPSLADPPFVAPTTPSHPIAVDDTQPMRRVP